MNWQETRTRLSEYGIVELSEKWEPGINLSGANLSGANLSGANLRWVDLTEADLTGANLSGANLTSANLTKARSASANLTDADLSDAGLCDACLCDADLRCTNLYGADLRWADLRGVDLTNADLSRARLEGADLTGADLTEADLRGVDLHGANLSGAMGILEPAEWLAQNLEACTDGYIVYKRIGKTYMAPPAHWIIESGKYLAEVVNPDRSTECGCGVNVGTRKWCEDNYTDTVLWRCLIEWRDLPGVIVPFNTDGKIRAIRVKLLEIVED